MDERQSQEAPRFRQSNEGDIDACSRLAWNAWASDSTHNDEQASPKVMEGYVRTFLARSNWTEVAYDSHGVIGVLFGRIGRRVENEWSESITAVIHMIPQFLFGIEGHHVSPVVLWHFFTTEFKVLVNVPRSDAEVNLIIVDSEFRGRGLGKTLMDRFISTAKKAGSKLVTLYTDDQASNWRFYEVIGFRKVATFHDGLTTYFVEKDANGIVYVLDIR